MKWIIVALLVVALSIGVGAASLLFAFVGHQTGISGAFLALVAGLWLLYVLLVPEYPPAPRQGHKREESK